MGMFYYTAIIIISMMASSSSCNALLLPTSTPPAFFQPHHAYTFTSLSYDLGVRHIHTPEYAIESHGLAAPGFNILSTQPPDVIGEYAIIHFTYATYIDQGKGVMFTREKARSHMLLASRNTKSQAHHHLLATFEVQQHTNNNRGHTLRVSSTRLLPITPLEKILCIAVQPLAMEEVLARGYAKYGHEDPNLLAYRQMVLFSCQR